MNVFEKMASFKPKYIIPGHGSASGLSLATNNTYHYLPPRSRFIFLSKVSDANTGSVPFRLSPINIFSLVVCSSALKVMVVHLVCRLQQIILIIIWCF
jgi:hypothetical protein